MRKFLFFTLKITMENWFLTDYLSDLPGPLSFYTALKITSFFYNKFFGFGGGIFPPLRDTVGILLYHSFLFHYSSPLTYLIRTSHEFMTMHIYCSKMRQSSNSSRIFSRACHKILPQKSCLPQVREDNFWDGSKLMRQGKAYKLRDNFGSN